MPLLKLSDNKFPDWSEIQSIRIINLFAEHRIEFIKDTAKAALFVTTGECIISENDIDKLYSEGDFLFTQKQRIIITGNENQTSLVLITGDWSDERGSAGIFRLQPGLYPFNSGDPTEYERNTEFDNHYHDCDEYWIILEGSGVAVSEGIMYNIIAGDIIATKAGHHHDLPIINGYLHGIYFETSLTGKKRTGHLWIHTHGLPDKINDGKLI